MRHSLPAGWAWAVTCRVAKKAVLMLAKGALFIFRACPCSCREGRWCPQPMWATAAICFRLLGYLVAMLVYVI